MSVYCAPWGIVPLLVRPEMSGSSDAAASLRQLLKAAFKEYSKPRTQLIEPEIMALVEESQGEDVQVEKETARTALNFMLLLPRSLPIPEVSADPDGEISFDWIGSSGKMFSVSVNKEGRIAYAGRFGERSKVHGIEQLSETCPIEIIRGIQRSL
jgi:hypothetical protein